MGKQLTLGLFFITSSGQQYQTHNQVVEVKPFGRASKRGVDHLEWQAERAAWGPLLVSDVSPTTTTQLESLAKPFFLCRWRNASNQIRDSGVLARWVRLRRQFASTDSTCPIFTGIARAWQNGGRTGTWGNGCQFRGLPCLSVRTHTHICSMGWSQTSYQPAFLPNPQDHLQPGVTHSRKYNSKSRWEGDDKNSRNDASEVKCRKAP